MRLLLIAYEFPPSPSPQSLRWTYLTRELAVRGHQVHVLTIYLGGDMPGLPALPASIEVTRTFAGPIRGLLAYLRDRRQRSHGGASPAPASAGDVDAIAPALRPPRTWKQNLSEFAQALATRFIFPDVRGEWRPWAGPALRRVLREFAPDAVISSHEPATSLELGLLARREGFRWIADLGDPVLAPYTPERWRHRALALERRTCEQADHLIVTHSGAAELMARRHGRGDRVSVIGQGFAPDDPPGSATATAYDPARLELLYTGSFYSFRRPDELIAALAAHPAVRLNIASVSVPESLLRAAQALPAQIRLLGFLPHQQALRMQRAADVLVNIANADPSQVPGKFYEYLGARRPILHIGRGRDAIADQLRALARGWAIDESREALEAWLAQAVEDKRTGRLEAGLRLDAEAVAAHAWPALGAQLERILLDAMPATASSKP